MKQNKQGNAETKASQGKRIAVMFPGQGSQTVGMLAELAEQYPIVQQTFAEASEALGFDLWQISQDETQLNKTEYTQPALLAGSMAVWRILVDKLPHPPIYLAGHSLGEYSALCASGVLTLADAVQLVHQRGLYMQSAVAGIETKMAAVLGLEDNQVTALCEQVVDTTEDANVSAANFNSPGQVVVAGNAIGVDALLAQVGSMGKKAVALKVSVPSHCSLMQPASVALEEALEKVSFSAPKIAVIQNRHAQSEKTVAQIKQALIEQISEPVQWTKTMQLMADKHINILVECGAGNVLSNLAKRQATPIASYPTDKPNRLEQLMEILA